MYPSPMTNWGFARSIGTFLVGLVGCGLALRWLGEEINLSAPWWAWSLVLGVSFLIVCVGKVESDVMKLSK